MKIEGSGSASGSGSISQRHGSADLNPHQNVMDPQHWYPGQPNNANPCGSPDAHHGYIIGAGSMTTAIYWCRFYDNSNILVQVL